MNWNKETLFSCPPIKQTKRLATMSITTSACMLYNVALSSIAPGRSSRLHPVPTQSCCIKVLAGRPIFSRPCKGIHGSISLMSSSLLLQQSPACLARLTWIVFAMGGRTAVVLWGVASSTCSIEHAAFLCNCCRAFSLYVKLASVWWIHIVVSTQPLLGKNCVLFYRSCLTSIWPMPLLDACWCHSRLMRCCFWGRWTCPQVSKDYPLMWYHLLMSCLRWHGGLCHLLLVQDYVAGIWVGRVHLLYALSLSLFLSPIVKLIFTQSTLLSTFLNVNHQKQHIIAIS